MPPWEFEVSTIDADHVNGIVTLLVSDNLWPLCQVLGQAASAECLSANALGLPAITAVTAAPRGDHAARARTPGAPQPRH